MPHEERNNHHSYSDNDASGNPRSGLGGIGGCRHHRAVQLTRMHSKFTTTLRVNTWSCKNCGKYFDSADCTNEIQKGSWKLDALGYGTPKEFQVETKASFTQDGNMVRKCTRCDEAITQAIPKITAKLSTTVYTYSGKTVTVKGYTKTSKKISKLKKKKTYYVRVRTYKKVGKTTFYSTWSKTKHIKTK